jgi:hypothetical protein
LQALVHPGGFNHGVLPISKAQRYSLLLFFCIDGGLMWGRYFVPTSVHHQRASDDEAFQEASKEQGITALMTWGHGWWELERR